MLAVGFTDRLVEMDRNSELVKDQVIYEKCNINMVMDTVLLQERNVGIAGAGGGGGTLIDFTDSDNTDDWTVTM